MAMATKSVSLDRNNDGNITVGELRQFLNSDGSRRGDLVYGLDEVLFGDNGNWANLIPVRDRNNPQGRYPRDYIPMPSR